MIKRIIESQTLTKHISCKYKCGFDRKCNSNQKWNNINVDVRAKNGKYSGCIIGDSLIKCDKIIEVTKTVPAKTIAMKFFYVLLAFLLITISLLVIVSIYCFIIKH